MPELPEVETAVRGLRDPLVGRTITAVTFPADPGRMTNVDPAQMAERLAGQRILSIDRRAKYLIFTLSTDALIVHLKMTGHLYVLPAGETDRFDRWVRVRFSLDNGQELRFSDTRKFGRVFLSHAPQEVLPELGPEPLEDDFTLTAFQERIKGRKGLIKSLLLNQAFIAGVGNIYADEALHIARLNPQRTADSLTHDEIARLYTGIRQALSDGILHEGASVNSYRKPDGSRGESQNYLRVYRTVGHLDLPCPICGGPITKIWVGQRGTHFCPVCQPLQPKRLSRKSATKSAKRI